MATDIEHRIAACERENAGLKKRIARQNIGWLAALLLVAGTAVATGAVPTASHDTIRTTEVVIVDGRGVVRARLGGDLPDAVAPDGRVLHRGSRAAGLIIYDEQGFERGGYVTQDVGSNAMLTLDSKHDQSVLLVAGPDKQQASALRLWTDESAIELRSDSAGSRLTAFDGSGVVLQQPAVAEIPGEVCTIYRQARAEHPNACRERFTEAACAACFERQ